MYGLVSVTVPWLNLSDDNVQSCLRRVHFKGTAASVVSPRVMGSGGEAFGWATGATAANLRIIPAIAEARFGPLVPRCERTTTSRTPSEGGTGHSEDTVGRKSTKKHPGDGYPCLGSGCWRGGETIRKLTASRLCVGTPADSPL